MKENLNNQFIIQKIELLELQMDDCKRSIGILLATIGNIHDSLGFIHGSLKMLDKKIKTNDPRRD